MQSGSKTLKDAMNEALRDWVTNVERHVLLHRHGRRPASLSGDGARFPIDHRPRDPRADAWPPKAGCRIRWSPASAAAPTPWACSIPSSTNAAIEIYGVEAAGHGIPSGQHAASIAGGRPGVLHGNRTYLLMNDDGQIEEAHSISAGLDYPGIGPEHAWLNDMGRVKFLSATDDEAVAAFQLVQQARRHHSGAGAGACAGARVRSGAEKAEGSPDGGQYVRPRRQGLGFASPPFLESKTPMTTRIDRRFAALKQEGRAALVTFTMAGDPDYDDFARHRQGAAESRRRRDRIGHAVHRSDGRWSGDPGRRRARAQGGQRMTKTLELVREFRKSDDATPIVLMGYYNPIYIYGVDRFLVDAKAAGVDGLIVVDLPPEEDDELCLPTLKAGLNFIRLATPTTDDKRLPAVLNNTSGFVYYVSITGITGAAAPDAGKVSAAVARIKRHTKLPVAVGFGVRTAEQARAIAENADGVVVGSALVDALRRASIKRQSRRRHGQGGDSLVSALADGVRSARRVAARIAGGYNSDGSSLYRRSMNWISNVVRPKIRSFLRRETPENLWIKCPETGQLVFFKDVEANQFVIPSSNYHMRISATARLKAMFDGATWIDIGVPEVPLDPLKFRDERRYADRLKDARAKTGLHDAVKLGLGTT